MIITQILGGLGNQMFQYAAARALSLRCDTRLLLDISSFDNYKLHNFELLRVFNHSLTMASQQDIRSVLRGASSSWMRRVTRHRALRHLCSRTLVREPHFHYWPGLGDVSPPCYLEGYWQSERYFVDIGNTIRDDFVFREPLADHNIALAANIAAVNAVSLHIRRGDYINNAATLAVHGLCHIEYYVAAVSYIAERVQDPQFFVFSDDIEWARENLNIRYPCRFIDHNCGTESYIDMRLMSLCQHNVIANSSFSWWGAWLNSHRGKIVIAPKRWFAKETNLQDLFPPSWVTL